MKKYIEITLLPNVDISLYFLWEKVYQQVHLAMVEMQDSEKMVDIGASFPKYNAKQFQLGCKLRFFAEEKQRLEELNTEKWLSRLIDYVQISEIEEVPESCAFAVYKRVQPKSSNARIARRKAKREGTSFEEAMHNLGNRLEEISRLPYIHIKSLSSEKKYKLFIEMQKSKQSRIGKFNTYGLSATATVPVF